MWELDYKASWAPKNWCFWTVVLEKILESSLDCKEIQPVHPEGSQSWIFIRRASLVAQTVKHPPTTWETQVQSLGWEDPLEKEMATHSGILAWKILWMEERGRLQSMGSQRLRHDWTTSLSFIGRTDAEAETPILWPPDVKNWLIGKDPDARKDCRREEKRTTKNEMIAWHHRVYGHEFE